MVSAGGEGELHIPLGVYTLGGMATREITSETLNATISDNDIVLLDFWASWCSPCRAFAPVFEKASDKHPDIIFGKIDTEAQQELAAAFEITSIPTLMVFREGIGIFAQPGALRGPDLEDLIGAVREVDMDVVREQIAAEAPEGAR